MTRHMPDAASTDAASEAPQTVTRAWKGLNTAFSCRGHAYAVGATYTLDGDAIICERGYHACLHPLDVLAYYGARSSRFAEVEMIGALVREDGGDSKVAATAIRIVREISYADLWQAHREWLATQDATASATGVAGHASATGDRGHASATGIAGDASATGDRGHASATGDRGHASATGVAGHASATGDAGHASATGVAGHASATGYSGHASATGDRGHASATGYSGHASATGYSGHASATGDRGHASATGANGIAVSIGRLGTASSAGWLVLARYDKDWNVVEVKAAKCGEGGLRPNTTYTLSSEGEFVDVGAREDD